MKFKCIKDWYGLKEGTVYEPDGETQNIEGLTIYSFLGGKVKLSNKTISKFMKEI
jgi:hypothetical protein